MSTTNRKILYFFESIRNDDSSLSFTVDEKNKTLLEIYKSMNRVNQEIQQLKIGNMQQEQYFRILLEHLATGIITYNSKGFIMHANSSAKKLLSIDVLTHLQQIERIDQKLYQAINLIKPSERRLIPFFTTRQSGSGIGLSISKQIMRVHGGNLKVRSVPGKETVFCINF